MIYHNSKNNDDNRRDYFTSLYNISDKFCNLYIKDKIYFSCIILFDYKYFFINLFLYFTFIFNLQVYSFLS